MKLNLHHSPRGLPGLEIISMITALLLIAPPAARGDPTAGIVATRHNLSVSGPGEVRAADETRICVFCHTPHTPRGGVMLWNRELPAGPFVMYRSPSLDAAAGKLAEQPGGASKLCLSCHDGTLALGAVGSQPKEIEMIGTFEGRIPEGRPGYIGRDLSGAHPISLQVTSQAVARNNARDSLLVPVEAMHTDPDVHLDRADRIQCTTCHDAHSDANYGSSGVHFYRKPRFSDVCDVCHRI